MVWSQTCLWFNYNTTDTHRAPPETLTVTQMLRWKKFFCVHSLFSAHQLDDGIGLRFHGNRSIPNPHPLIPDPVLWKSAGFGFDNETKSAEKRWVLGVRWMDSVGDVSGHVQPRYCCREKRWRSFVCQCRERLTRQSMLNGRATKHHLQKPEVYYHSHESFQVSRFIAAKLKDLNGCTENHH